MIKHNYHSHSLYCNHSEFTIDQLIQSAIELGMETMGVSEHTYLPDIDEHYRLTNKEQFNEYLDEMDKAKEKYKGQIRVLTGIESEITHPKTGKYMTEFINELNDNPRVDYVILGHHNFIDGGNVNGVSPTKETLAGYVDAFKEACKNAHILYIAHPDVFLRGAGKFTPEIEAACKEMIQAAVDNNIPLGINVNGMTYGEDFCYPHPKYFKWVAEAGGKCVIELDSHNKLPFQPENIQRAYDLAKKAGVEIIDKLI